MAVPDDVSDDGAALTYALVVVTEVLVIVALWLIERAFGRS